MDFISETLGIENDVNINDLVTYKRPTVKTHHDERDKKEDFETSRKTLHSLVENGEVILEGAIKAAMDSSSPRGYEVAGKLLESLAGISKDLVEIHKNVEKVESDVKTVNNNLIMTSTELLELINNGKQ